MDKPVVLLAGHSFLKQERFSQVNLDGLTFHSEAFSRPGLCFRDLEPKRPSRLGFSLVEELKIRCTSHNRPRPSALALVLGDNDFSTYDRVPMDLRQPISVLYPSS